MTAPLMIQAIGTAGGVKYTLHSLLTTMPEQGVSGVINVTPATEAVTAQAVGTFPEKVFANTTQIKNLDSTKLADAKARLNAALKAVLEALGQDSSKVDLFTTKFAANNTGLDKLLDLISFSSGVVADADGKTIGRAVRVTDKQTQVQVSIAPDADKTKVTALAPPSKETLALDTAKIKTLIEQFTNLLATTEKINSAAMQDLFTTDYMHQGRDRSAEISNLAANSVGSQITNYVVMGCDGQAKVCNGQVTLKTKEKIDTMPMSVKLGDDGKWRAYGDRNQFDFKVSTVLKSFASVDSSGKVTTGQPQMGLNIYFTGKIGSNARSFASAKFYLSKNGNSTTEADWVLVAELKAPSASGCGDFLAVIGTGSGCGSNFYGLDAGSAFVISVAAAQAKGLLWFKLDAYGPDDFSGSATTAIGRFTEPFDFNLVTAKAAIEDSGLVINTAKMGTDSVTFAGSPDYVNIMTSTSGNTTWGRENVAALRNSASVAAAKTLCGTTENCNTTYGSSATIKYINLSKRNPQGGVIWVEATKQ